LVILVKGIMGAVSGVGFIMIFLIGVMYVFAILFTSTVAEIDYDCSSQWDDEDVYWVAQCRFANIGGSMMTLWVNGVLGDNLADIAGVCIAHSHTTMWIFWVFFFISNMTLLNMLIGVLCEVVDAEASSEKSNIQESNLRFALRSALETLM